MLDRTNTWLSVVEVAAIVVSLIIVANEFRQNTEATVGQTEQGLLELLAAQDAWMLDSDFAAVVVKAEQAEEPLSTVESHQYTSWMTGRLNICEHVFNRHVIDLVSDDVWQAWDAGCGAMAGVPAVEQVWQEQRPYYGPGFVRYFDERIAAASP